MKEYIKLGFGFAIGHSLGVAILSFTVKKLNKALENIEVDLDVQKDADND